MNDVRNSTGERGEKRAEREREGGEGERESVSSVSTGTNYKLMKFILMKKHILYKSLIQNISKSPLLCPVRSLVFNVNVPFGQEKDKDCV